MGYSLLYMSATNSETACSTLLLVVINIMTKCNWEERVYLSPTLEFRVGPQGWSLKPKPWRRTPYWRCGSCSASLHIQPRPTHWGMVLLLSGLCPPLAMLSDTDSYRHRHNGSDGGTSSVGAPSQVIVSCVNFTVKTNHTAKANLYTC